MNRINGLYYTIAGIILLLAGMGILYGIYDMTIDMIHRIEVAKEVNNQ